MHDDEEAPPPMAYLFMNPVFAGFGLPVRNKFDQGTHVVIEIMQETWKLSHSSHICHCPMAWQVEQTNRIIISMLTNKRTGM